MISDAYSKSSDVFETDIYLLLVIVWIKYAYVNVWQIQTKVYNKLIR